MSKRLLLANTLLRLGGGLVSRFLNRELLFVINYHRVRPAEGPLETAFDAEVFGPSPVQLKDHLLFLKKNTTMLSEADLISVLAGADPGPGPYSMVTFDDTYIDNYQLALPLLVELKVPAIFFVPGLIVEERNIGWWDQIAFIIKNSAKSSLLFRGQTLPLGPDRAQSIHQLLTYMKLAPHAETANLLDELAEAAQSPRPSRELMDKELMNWEQLKKAHQAGITLGSHTLRHRVLATLTEEEQADEIINSKTFLEQKLGIPVRSLAFPVGGPAHFNQATLKLVEKAGYSLGFSYNTGVSKLGDFNRFAVPRMGTPVDMEGFRALFHFPRLMDYHAADRRKLAKARG